VFYMLMITTTAHINAWTFCGDTAPDILKIVYLYENGQRALRSLCIRGRSPRSLWTGGWPSLRARLDTITDTEVSVTAWNRDPILRSQPVA
jgi:hypothetical protein